MTRRLTKEQRRKLKLKTWAAGAAGAGLGAATGHTAVQAMRRSRTGRSFRKLPGNSRLEYLAPAGTAVAVGAYAANYKRKQAKRQYLEEQEIAGAVKTSSFDVTQWVLDSLIR